MEVVELEAVQEEEEEDGGPKPRENVDERPEKHKYPSVQIPGSCRGGRRVTRCCLATLTQGRD